MYFLENGVSDEIHQIGILSDFANFVCDVYRPVMKPLQWNGDGTNKVLGKFSNSRGMTNIFKIVVTKFR